MTRLLLARLESEVLEPAPDRPRAEPPDQVEALDVLGDKHCSIALQLPPPLCSRSIRSRIYSFATVSRLIPEERSIVFLDVLRHYFLFVTGTNRAYNLTRCGTSAMSNGERHRASIVDRESKE